MDGAHGHRLAGEAHPVSINPIIMVVCVWGRMAGQQAEWNWTRWRDSLLAWVGGCDVRACSGPPCDVDTHHSLRRVLIILITAASFNAALRHVRTPLRSAQSAFDSAARALVVTHNKQRVLANKTADAVQISLQIQHLCALNGPATSHFNVIRGRCHADCHVHGCLQGHVKPVHNAQPLSRIPTPQVALIPIPYCMPESVSLCHARTCVRVCARCHAA